MLLRPVQDENSFGLGPNPAKDGVENFYGGVKSLGSIPPQKKSFGGGTRKALGNITNQPTGKFYDTVRAKTPGTELKQRKALGDITNSSDTAKNVLPRGSGAKGRASKAEAPSHARRPELALDKAEAPLGRTWTQLESDRLQRERAERAARVRHIVSQPMRYPAPPLDEVGSCPRACLILRIGHCKLFPFCHGHRVSFTKVFAWFERGQEILTRLSLCRLPGSERHYAYSLISSCLLFPGHQHHLHLL
jgi:hypothetical protein